MNAARVETLDEIDSTNAEARRRAEAGEAGPLWLLARRQTAGRGRRGRAWAAPEGALSATCLLRPDLAPKQAALLSYAAALAVAELLEALAPAARVQLKWPNDALLNGRKVAGVLLEAAGDARRVDWVAVGFGVNLRKAPEAEPGAWPPGAVAAEGGREARPEAALAILAEAFARWTDRLSRDGFEPLRAAWLARAARLGERVTARLPGEEIAGVFADLDSEGALVLAAPLGERRVHAAEVFF